MQQVHLKSLDRTVSCLGFGCSRLDGKIGLKKSSRLLETALSLGITYFDVAASYGTAEEALGKVLGDSPEVVIATKVGPPRRPYHPTKQRLKAFVKPALDRMRPVKAALAEVLAKPQNTPRARYDFSESAIRHSLQQSLHLLNRRSVDIFMAHEPHREDLTPKLSATFDALRKEGTILAYGVGVGAEQDPWAPFGSIWQSAWPGANAAKDPQLDYIYHGVLRNAEKDRFGRHVRCPTELIREAHTDHPDAVLLVSTSTPKRLREIVESVR